MSGYVWQAWKQQNNRTSLLDSTQFWPFRLPMYDIVCTVSCTVLSYKAGWKNMVFLYHASYKATFCMVHFTVFFSIVQNVLCKMYLFHIRNGLIEAYYSFLPLKKIRITPISSLRRMCKGPELKINDLNHMSLKLSFNFGGLIVDLARLFKISNSQEFMHWAKCQKGLPERFIAVMGVKKRAQKKISVVWDAVQVMVYWDVQGNCVFFIFDGPTQAKTSFPFQFLVEYVLSSWSSLRVRGLFVCLCFMPYISL